MTTSSAPNTSAPPPLPAYGAPDTPPFLQRRPSVMVTVLVIVACVLCVIGLFLLSQATMGVGVMVGACFLGIMARIAQAREHRRS